MAVILRWVALFWAWCAIFYIVFFDVTLVQVFKAFLPPITLILLSLGFPEKVPDDDPEDPARKDVDEETYRQLTEPVGRSETVIEGKFDKRSA